MEESKLQRDFNSHYSVPNVTPRIPLIEFDFEQVHNNFPLIRSTHSTGYKATHRSHNAKLTIAQAITDFSKSIGCDESEKGKQAINRALHDGFTRYVYNIIHIMDRAV